MMTCSIEGCGRPTGGRGTARGFCSGHYHRWQRYGDPHGGGVLRDRDPLGAVARKIDFLPSGCWEWTGSLLNGGHGNAGVTSAHKRVWELTVAQVPEGLQLDHLCRNKRCVNPDHLEPVTPVENIRRSNEALGRGQYATHCPHGHEYTEANTRRDRHGWRYCITCAHARARRAAGVR